MVGIDQRAESFGEAPGAIRARGHGLRAGFETRVEPALAGVNTGDDGGDRGLGSGLTLNSLGAQPAQRCAAALSDHTAAAASRDS